MSIISTLKCISNPSDATSLARLFGLEMDRKQSDGLKSKMLNTFIYESDAVLFVYDITNRSSFEAIPNLVKLVQHSLAENKVEYALLGNKNDLFNQIAVEEDSSQHLSKMLNIPYYSVSAKMGSNVNECFKQITCKACNIITTSDEKKNEKISQSALPDLRSEVKGNLQPSKSSSGCFIF